MYLRIGLGCNRRHFSGGGPHLIGRTSERVEPFTYLSLEGSYVIFDCLLTGGSGCVAFTLLALDIGFLNGILLEGVERTGESPDFIIRIGVGNLGGQIA